MEAGPRALLRGRISLSFTYTTTFTESKARYIASKVAGDLRQMMRVYGRPTEGWIDRFIEELAILLPKGYVDSVDYGFQANGRWLIVLRYTAQSDGALSRDDRSGGVPLDVGAQGADFRSFLRPSANWWKLSAEERERVERSLPFRRTAGNEPETADGLWVDDKVYSSGGVGVSRRVFRPYG